MAAFGPAGSGPPSGASGLDWGSLPGTDTRGPGARYSRAMTTRCGACGKR